LLKLDFDLSQRREEEDKEKDEEDVPTDPTDPTESRPSFLRSVKRNPPTRYREDVDSDGGGDYDDDIYAPPSSSSASSYVRDTRIITLATT
jgi:hypothetical protein